MPDQFSWPELVSRATASATKMMGGLDEQSWSDLAAAVTWDCRSTIEHVGGVLVHYAGQVVQSPSDRYVAFSFDLSRAQTHAELVEAVAMAGGLLAAAVSYAPPAARGWHPQGQFSPADFAAMGTCEALVHGYDIAAGLEIGWLPEDDASEAVVQHLFPDAVVHLRNALPSEVLLWATGRLQIPGEPSVSSWDYRRGAG